MNVIKNKNFSIYPFIFPLLFFLLLPFPPSFPSFLIPSSFLLSSSPLPIFFPSLSFSFPVFSLSLLPSTKVLGSCFHFCNDKGVREPATALACRSIILQCFTLDCVGMGVFMLKLEKSLQSEITWSLLGQRYWAGMGVQKKKRKKNEPGNSETINHSGDIWGWKLWWSMVGSAETSVRRANTEQRLVRSRQCQMTSVRSFRNRGVAMLTPVSAVGEDLSREEAKGLWGTCIS